MSPLSPEPLPPAFPLSPVPGFPPSSVFPSSDVLLFSLSPVASVSFVLVCVLLVVAASVCSSVSAALVVVVSAAFVVALLFFDDFLVVASSAAVVTGVGLNVLFDLFFFIRPAIATVTTASTTTNAAHIAIIPLIRASALIP